MNVQIAINTTLIRLTDASKIDERMKALGIPNSRPVLETIAPQLKRHGGRQLNAFEALLALVTAVYEHSKSTAHPSHGDWWLTKEAMYEIIDVMVVDSDHAELVKDAHSRTIGNWYFC
jgi:hypothetical protein